LHSSYHNDDARNVVLAARRETDPAKRQVLYSKLQNIVNTECPFVYLDEKDRLYASSAAINGFVPNAQGKYSLENVWKQ
jgi:peptide/nickel transport system substrate-binding protein